MDVREIGTGAVVSVRPRADTKSGALKLVTSFGVPDKVADELKRKSSFLDDHHDPHSKHFAKMWTAGTQPSEPQGGAGAAQTGRPMTM